jgi:hypothetical protein
VGLDVCAEPPEKDLRRPPMPCSELRKASGLFARWLGRDYHQGFFPPSLSLATSVSLSPGLREQGRNVEGRRIGVVISEGGRASTSPRVGLPSGSLPSNTEAGKPASDGLPTRDVTKEDDMQSGLAAESVDGFPPSPIRDNPKACMISQAR